MPRKIIGYEYAYDFNGSWESVGINSFIGNVVESDSNTLVTIKDGRPAYSLDHGKTWIDATIDVTLDSSTWYQTIVKTSDGALLAGRRYSDTPGRNDPIILKSVDGGLSWQRLGLSTSYEGDCCYIISTRDGGACAFLSLSGWIMKYVPGSGISKVAQDVYINKCTSYDKHSFIWENDSGSIMLLAASSTSGSVGNIVYSYDFGATWQSCGTRSLNTPVTIYHTKGDKTIVSDRNYVLTYSSDFSTSTFGHRTDGSEINTPQKLRNTFEIGNDVFILGDDELLKSTDGGESWERIYYDVDHLKRILVTSSNSIIMTKTTGAVLKSTDEGATFKQVFELPPSSYPYYMCYVSEKNMLLYQTGAGVYLSMDDGETWSETNITTSSGSSISTYAFSPDVYFICGSRPETIVVPGNDLLLSQTETPIYEDIDYLDRTGLKEVAKNVNTRLKTVTAMPSTASNGAVRLFVGESFGGYNKGHTYQAKDEYAYCFTAKDSEENTMYAYAKELETSATIYSGSASWTKATSIAGLVSIPAGFFEIVSIDENSLVVTQGGTEFTFIRSSPDDLNEFNWIDITPSGPSGVTLNINPTAEQIASYPDGAMWLEVEG